MTIDFDKIRQAVLDKDNNDESIVYRSEEHKTLAKGMNDAVVNTVIDCLKEYHDALTTSLDKRS